MLASTGLYISGNITETGRFAFASVSETGEYAPTSEANNGYLAMFGGLLVGGEFTLPYYFAASGGIVSGGTFPLHTTSSITTVGGFVVGANMVNKQIPYDMYAPAALAFGLSDASINFKLEQQP